MNSFVRESKPSADTGSKEKAGIAPGLDLDYALSKSLAQRRFSRFFQAPR